MFPSSESHYILPPPPPPPPPNFAARTMDDAAPYTRHGDQDFPRTRRKRNNSNMNSVDENTDIDDKNSPVDKKEQVQVGMTAEAKDLYREDYRSPWQEWSPDDIGIDSKSTPDSEKFALIVRREKVQSDTGEPVLRMHSISVQSPLIKKRLGPVFAGYQGINTNLKKLEFNAPFHEFFYRWEEFSDQATKGHESDEEKHYKLLFDIISPEVQPHIEQTEDLLNNKVISFDYVWALFEPGTEIHCKVQDEDRLYLLNDGKYQQLPDGTKIYVISCRYIDTDGEFFGYRATSLSIRAFENVTPISELNVLPSHLRPGISEIRVRLEQRGRKFEKLRGTHYMAYSGAYNLRKPAFGAASRQILEGGRVMIDCASYMRYTGETPEKLGPLEGPATTPNYSNSMSSDASFDSSDDDVFDDIPPLPVVQLGRYLARQTRRKYAAYQPRSADNTCLSEKHYALCSHIVKGFCLKAKDWEWNGDVFKHLVLPEDYKRIVWAFVDSQLSRSDDFDDVVRGKGKGIIMLLSGEPGTGKTLTSESVAETMKKPLYSMSAGELGDAAGEVETNLRRVLELSAKWDAVLLIDECDIFLEKRTTSDLQRNKIVSVFLRLLEYYQGVMFLTTNRVASFDPAFESRIHLTINYPELNFDSRLHIWKTFIKPGPGSAVQEAELERLSRIRLNGRQIKNVVKTARLLASREQKALALEHLEVVLRVKNCLPIDAPQAVVNE
ncbi:P-loop containing nucleoside triphosphate hydrolase protein [Xylaria sp. FL1777]|nr:P-loop containing nucleoside triphosphate hydrolase protein [Xylaria sp. FL1777]